MASSVVCCVGMPPRRLLVIGCGGVGTAVLSLLDGHRLGREILGDDGAVFVLDQRAVAELRPGMTSLPPTAITSAEQLRPLLAKHQISDVVELSFVDTLECAGICDAAGVNYLSTSLETWLDDVPDRAANHNLTLPDAFRLLPGRRPTLTGASHLIGSGMNPGLVNALALVGIGRFAEAAGVAADALDLCAITITEEDTTTARNPVIGFGSTWSPLGCIDELFEPEAMFMDADGPRGLGHGPTEVVYQARCGNRQIEGFVVAHDELVTLGHRIPGVELAFVYRLPPAARAFLATTPAEPPEDFPTTALYPPHRHDLTGADTVGVLLTSRRHGEFWLGFETDCTRGRAWGTNATELQVAAGVLAGLRQLGRKPGVHTIEETDVDQLLADAEEVLGPRLEVLDRNAPARRLTERRV